MTAQTTENGPSIRAPLQSRSRETMDRLLDAAESLLADRSFESITIADIVREAGSSVGSFYARFANKEALLPALYMRYDADLRESTERQLRDLEARQLTLEQHARHVVELAIGRLTDRQWVMRAMALHARQSPESISDDVRAHRTRFHHGIVKSFLRHRDRIAHDDAERAIGTALFMVIAACREKLLFGDAPHAASFETTKNGLVDDMTHALIAYLTCAPSHL